MIYLTSILRHLVYLRSLAEARLDLAFREALERAGSAIKEDRDVLWMSAAHAWNTGDIDLALDVMDQVLSRWSQDPQARLFRIQCLLRLNRLIRLGEELEFP